MEYRILKDPVAITGDRVFFEILIAYCRKLCCPAASLL